MQQLLKVCLLLSAISWTACANPQPYCYRNVTETSYKVVTKTRLKNVSSKNFFKKITFKKDTQLEVYEDQEPVFKVKLERNCCEGYKLTELDLCEPQCIQNGCPRHSKCVEPEVCECLKGYFSTRAASDGKHYCEPICEKPCPQHSACVAPNECACHKGYHVKADTECVPYCASGCPHDGVCVAHNICSCPEGYKSEKGSCLAICSVGDHCENGKCVANERCICNPGYRWNNETLQCEFNQFENSTFYPDYMEAQQNGDAIMEVESDIETSNEEVDPNEVFDETSASTNFYVTNEYDSSTTSAIERQNKCPLDYVFHKGECRPLKFVSNKIDCWLRPCQDKHAVCLENGTCACSEGFQLFKTRPANDSSLINQNITTTSECLSAAEYEAKVQKLKEDPQQESVNDTRNWTLIFFTILGVSIVLLALVYLGIRLLSKQTGEVDVEGKTLACSYSKRPTTETVKSII